MKTTRTAWLALVAAALAPGSLHGQEPEPTLDQIRRGQIRQFPIPMNHDLELVRESFDALQRALLPNPPWPDYEAFTDVPVVLITPECEYVIDHPTPPASHFLVPAGLQTMQVYGLETTRDCHVSTARPMFGAPCVVKGTRDCTGESSTQWMFDYIRRAFRAYLYRQSELLKISSLNLPFPDPEEKWKATFPFPYEDPEVIAAVRELGQLLHVATWLPEEQATEAIESYFPARRRLDELLESHSNQYSATDFFRYYTWAEGIPYYAAYAAFEFLSRSPRTPPELLRTFEDFTPFRTFRNSELDERFRSMGTITEEPLTQEDLALIGALTLTVVQRNTSDWKAYALERDVWLEDLMARARLDAN